MKILICDDHAVFRQGLGVVLSSLDGTLLEAGSADEALRLVSGDPQIELVLLDLRMPGVDGWQTLRLLRSNHPTIPVVILSASEDPSDVREALDGGASGFIPKSSSPELIRSALGVVFSGGVYVPPEILGTGFESGNGGGASVPIQSAEAAALTPRQLEVLQLMSKGLTNKEIGGVLEIAMGTVKAHIQAVLEGLGVSNRTEAVLVMRELGLEDADD